MSVVGDKGIVVDDGSSRDNAVKELETRFYSSPALSATSRAADLVRFEVAAVVELFGDVLSHHNTRVQRMLGEVLEYLWLAKEGAG